MQRIDKKGKGGTKEEKRKKEKGNRGKIRIEKNPRITGKGKIPDWGNACVTITITQPQTTKQISVKGELCPGASNHQSELLMILTHSPDRKSVV